MQLDMWWDQLRHLSKHIRFNTDANRSFQKGSRCSIPLISQWTVPSRSSIGGITSVQKTGPFPVKRIIFQYRLKWDPHRRKMRAPSCVCCDVRQTSKTLWMVKFYSSRSTERGREIERNSATVQKSSCEIHTKNIVLTLHRLYCKSAWWCIPVWIYKRCIQV